MRILSFDVGIVNLAMCMVNVHELDLTFEKWDVLKIPTNVPQIIDFLNKKFESLIYSEDKDITILIEKQPSRNVKMRVVEAILQCFFCTHGFKNTHTYSAKFKLGSKIGSTVKGIKNYSQRKKISVQLTKQFLDCNKSLDFYKNVFMQSKKKDDLADAFLQILSYIKHPFYDSDEANVAVNDVKVIGRKPTEKQEKGTYSRANLKYMFEHNSKIDNEKNPKIIKAIKKWYKGDLNDAYTNLHVCSMHQFMEL